MLRVLVYAPLFGMGTLPLDSVFASLPYFGAAALAAMVLYRDLSRPGWGGVTGERRPGDNTNRVIMNRPQQRRGCIRAGHTALLAVHSEVVRVQLGS